YFRIGLVFAAWAAHETPATFVLLYSIFIALDGVDGWLARRLGQCSRFGAWLDVVVDNLGRGLLWSLLFKWAWLVSAVEWCVFVCNHSATGDQWKNSFISSPRLIQAIMANGKRRVSDPSWHMGGEWAALPPPVAVWIWCIWTHIEHLTEDEPEQKRE
ncbi:hypothetical protein F7725_020276, partial [Dissostichus mawsoni]